MSFILRTPSLRIGTATMAFLGVMACAPRDAWAQVVVPDGFSHEVIVPGLTLPVGMAFLPDWRLLVVEQYSARVRLVVNETLLADVGTVPAVSTNAGERGLLGIAVDPRWPTSPYIYTHSTATGNVIRISRFTVTGDLSFTSGGLITFDPASRYDLINDIPDGAPNHNGGTLRFGTDDMLYVSLGEDATRCAAQDTSTLRGVILRLDVMNLPAGPGGPPARSLITPSDNPFAGASNQNRRLIWATGLRNPFRFHIDPQNGVLYIADVGEGHWEEIDRAAQPGLNFGWPVFEGLDLFAACPISPSDYTDPIHTYDRTGVQTAVIGAGIYRAPSGASVPFPSAYEGDYFLSDYFPGFLRRLHGVGGSWSVAAPVPGQPTADHWGEGFDFVSDYLIGPDGSLWFCRQTNSGGGAGSIERVVAAPGTPRPPPFGVSFGPPLPTPASGAVRFDYTLTDPAPVTLDLYDLNGRLVRRLVTGRDDAAGPHSEPWNGVDDDGRLVRSGLYVAKLEAGGVVVARRVLIVR